VNPIWHIFLLPKKQQKKFNSYLEIFFYFEITFKIPREEKDRLREREIDKERYRKKEWRIEGCVRLYLL
jgi:hypothetical protein